jgi:hypothetical protein
MMPARAMIGGAFLHVILMMSGLMFGDVFHRCGLSLRDYQWGSDEA